MVLSPLFRNCHIEGPNGLWANYNNERDYTCSFDGYLMCLTPPRFARLDDMTYREEKEFWDFTFVLAAEGAADPKKEVCRNRAPSAKASHLAMLWLPSMTGR